MQKKIYKIVVGFLCLVCCTGSGIVYAAENVQDRKQMEYSEIEEFFKEEYSTENEVAITETEETLIESVSEEILTEEILTEEFLIEEYSTENEVAITETEENLIESISEEMLTEELIEEIEDVNNIDMKSYNSNQQVNISITLNNQIIPESASQNLVKQGIILYKITVNVFITDLRGKPLTNKVLYISSLNNNAKMVACDKTTNVNGIARAVFEVRGADKFRVRATCNGKVKDVDIKPNVKCSYQKNFYITAYNIALESDYTNNKVEANGLSNYKFRKGFLDAVKMNGSGYSTDNGFYIRYNSSTEKYERKNPVTSTGTTPTAGRTIAVDNYYIPRYRNQLGCVEINNIGKRKAEDAGGRIKKYHIDVFVGNGNDAVNKFIYKSSYRSVKYLGNNVF